MLIPNVRRVTYSGERCLSDPTATREDTAGDATFTFGRGEGKACTGSCQSVRRKGLCRPSSKRQKAANQ